MAFWKYLKHYLQQNFKLIKSNYSLRLLMQQQYSGQYARKYFIPIQNCKCLRMGQRQILPRTKLLQRQKQFHFALRLTQLFTNATNIFFVCRMFECVSRFNGLRDRTVNLSICLIPCPLSASLFQFKYTKYIYDTCTVYPVSLTML